MKVLNGMIKIISGFLGNNIIKEVDRIVICEGF